MRIKEMKSQAQLDPAIPQSPFPKFDIDPEILPLVQAMNRGQTSVTLGSCCGHGKGPAHIDFTVLGVAGVRDITARLNRLQRQFERTLYFELALNWDEEVATACEFDRFPDWISLSLSIESKVAEGPSPAVLKRLAKYWNAE